MLRAGPWGVPGGALDWRPYGGKTLDGDAARLFRKAWADSRARAWPLFQWRAIDQTRRCRCRIAASRTGVDELRESGAASRFTAVLGVLAEGLADAGQLAEGLATIDEALARCERNEDRWCSAWLLRVKGELVLLENKPDAVAVAEGYFRQALEWARRQGALSWELRAATSLARLWRDQGRTKDARELLAPVYDRFTEGFETADLKATKALLDELTA